MCGAKVDYGSRKESIMPKVGNLCAINPDEPVINPNCFIPIKFCDTSFQLNSATIIELKTVIIGIEGTIGIEAIGLRRTCESFRRSSYTIGQRERRRSSYADNAHPDELDEEFDTFPTSRSPDLVKMRYDHLRSIAGRIQTVVGDLATQGEQLQSLLSWRDPRATSIFVIFCLIAAIVLYVTLFQVIVVITGFYKECTETELKNLTRSLHWSKWHPGYLLPKPEDAKGQNGKEKMIEFEVDQTNA
ncbi:hypothetical protein L1887_36368 [Cichorium endivia]|nr:hypothetical protein L1887_36368 [Cichorium endivia]